MYSCYDWGEPEQAHIDHDNIPHRGETIIYLLCGTRVAFVAPMFPRTVGGMLNAPIQSIEQDYSSTDREHNPLLDRAHALTGLGDTD